MIKSNQIEVEKYDRHFFEVFAIFATHVLPFNLICACRMRNLEFLVDRPILGPQINEGILQLYASRMPGILVNSLEPIQRS
jgi:hypothetical protein